MPQPLIELGGQLTAPVMHIAVANGFPPQTYIPMLRPLMVDYRVVSLPPRALWGGEISPSGYRDWWMLADDLLAGLDQYHLQDVIAIGHSFGAIGSLLAVTKEPERFRALILLDPTILLPHILELTALAWANDAVEMMPLVQGAKRRRREFDSVDDAFDRFREKKLFQQWSDETLRLYVEHGTQPAMSGDGVELRWSAGWEAYYFSTVHQTIWDDLAPLNGLVPTLFLRGGASDTFVPEAEDRTRNLVPSADYDVIDGHGHLFPQSAPLPTSAKIASWLKSSLD